MMEVGPWRVDGQGGLKMITGGWDEYANIVFGAFSAASSFHSAKAYNIAQSTSQRVLASPTQAPIGTLLNSLMCAYSWLQPITHTAVDAFHSSGRQTFRAIHAQLLRRISRIQKCRSTFRSLLTCPLTGCPTRARRSPYVQATMP